MVAGALLWWLIALFDSNAAGYHGYELGVFAYVLLALPGIALVGQCTAWLLTTVERQADAFIIRALEDANVLWYLLGTGVIYTALGLRNFGRCRFTAVWASLALVALSCIPTSLSGC
jgi:hypothetical protein